MFRDQQAGGVQGGFEAEGGRARVVDDGGLRRSVGVTARRDSMQLAALPARMPRGVERCPWGSERAILMASKVRKRTEALNAVPWLEWSESLIG